MWAVMRSWRKKTANSFNLREDALDYSVLIFINIDNSR